MCQAGSIQNFVIATGHELTERLEYFEVDFSSILVIGMQNDTVPGLLAEKWPNSVIQQNRQNNSFTERWSDSEDASTNTDQAKFTLPFDSGSFDLVISNLAVTFYPPGNFASECFRLLRDGGVLMVSAFGPDFLDQFEKACKELQELEFNAAIIDMHNFADLLLATGFTNPVVDTDRQQLRYDNSTAFLQTYRDSDLAKKMLGNPHALDDELVRSKLSDHFAQHQNTPEEFLVNVEVFFAVAWKTPSNSNTTFVQFHAD